MKCKGILIPPKKTKNPQIPIDSYWNMYGPIRKPGEKSVGSDSLVRVRVREPWSSLDPREKAEGTFQEKIAD